MAHLKSSLLPIPSIICDITRISIYVRMNNLLKFLRNIDIITSFSCSIYPHTRCSNRSIPFASFPRGANEGNERRMTENDYLPGQIEFISEAIIFRALHCTESFYSELPPFYLFPPPLIGWSVISQSKECVISLQFPIALSSLCRKKLEREGEKQSIVLFVT